MKRLIHILIFSVFFIMGSISVTSCRGKATLKGVEMLKKVTTTGGKTVKKVLPYTDDAARAVNSNSSDKKLKVKTVECTSCDGYGKVNFIDEDGEYLYTGDCPDCEGNGRITKYEFE